MERKEGPVVVVVGVRQLPQRIDRVSRVACACSWELGGHGIPTGTDSVGTRVSPASLSLSLSSLSSTRNLASYSYEERKKVW